MKIQDGKRFCVTLLLLGFLMGILYTNLFAIDYITASGIFNDFFLKQYQQIEVEPREYVWYLMRSRLLCLGCICLAGCTRLKKIVIVIVLLWTGFAGGMLITAAVLKLGVKGIVLCLVGMIPHFVCYIAVHMIALWQMLQYPQSKWNGTKVLVCLILMIVGIFLEAYVNPVLMKVFIQTF